MATRLYAVNPGDNSVNVIEGVGSATSSKIINLVVDIGPTLITDGSTQRAPSREEVLLALQNITEHIIRVKTWPPAP